MVSRGFLFQSSKMEGNTKKSPYTHITRLGRNSSDVFSEEFGRWIVNARYSFGEKTCEAIYPACGVWLRFVWWKNLWIIDGKEKISSKKEIIHLSFSELKTVLNNDVPIQTGSKKYEHGDGHDSMHILKKKERGAFFLWPLLTKVGMFPNYARQGQSFPNGSKRNQK